MTKEEYLKIKNEPKADNLPILFFFAQLKGLRGVRNIQEFGLAFHNWILATMLFPGDLSVLRKVHEYVERELDKHFKIV